jgi:hypothetical protein
MNEKEKKLKDYREIYKRMIDTQFFIDTSGKIVRWKWGVDEAMDWISLHSGICHKLFPEIKNGTDYVYNLGWISMGSDVYGNRIKGEPTQAQINTLDRLGFYRIIDDLENEYVW